MAKKIQDLTKELSQRSEVLYQDVTKVKRSAEKLLEDLKKIENEFAQKEAAAVAEKMLEEQRKVIQSQSKAWTMPDDLPEEKPEVRKDEPKAATSAEKPVSTQAGEPAPAEKVKAEPKAEVSQEKAPAKASEKPAEKPLEKREESVHPEKATAQQGAEAQPAAGKTPAQPQENAQAAAQQGQRAQQPAGAQSMPRPAGQAQRPGQAAGGQPRPMGQTPRPGQQQGSYQQRPTGQRMGQQQGTYQQRGQGQGGYNGTAGGQGGYQQRNQGFQQRQGQDGRYQGQGQNRQGQGQSGQQGRPFGQNQQRAAQPGGARPAGGGQRPTDRRVKKSEPEIIPSMEKERVSNYDPNKKMRQRQHDPEHQTTKNKKQLARESGYDGLDDEIIRGRRKKQGKQEKQQKIAPFKIETAYMTAETITVRDLTERIGKPAGEIIKKLMLLGIMATINQELDFDTASLVASEFGVTLEMKLDKTAEDALLAEKTEDDEADLVPRPPVMTVMGHVDHGKTSLLDYIRKTKVTDGEAGGITQHIGAYVAQVNGRSITFLDTPGHEAFTAMRARGTQATDIAILVVAADDGVMPQTIESIHHARAAKCPVIVAINKIDKPGADPDVVKQELTQYELIPEEWGGDTIMVPVSAKTGEGVDELLENVLLLADMLELKANPNRKARGVIIEAKLDNSRGSVATALIQNGTLNVGDMVVAGNTYGRVRAMVSSRGDRVKTALPATPVEIIGFGAVPEAGDEFIAVEDEKLVRQVVEERAAKVRVELSKKSSASTLEELYSRMAEGEVKDLNIIIKADVQGSVEAVKQSLEKLSNDKVHIRTIHSGVGGVTENDVMLAGIDGATIIGFNVRPDGKAREAAARDGIDIRYYRIIYQAIEDIEKAMKGLLTPEYKENVLGHAEVRNVFKITGVGTIAGCYVTDGKIQRNAQVRLLRDNVVVFEGKLSSLQRFKDSVREVADGYECGVGLENYADIKNGDVVECFLMEEIAVD